MGIICPADSCNNAIVAHETTEVDNALTIREVGRPLKVKMYDLPFSHKKTSIVSCSGISKTLGKFTLGPIDFNLNEGEITGVVGINGSGKSTLLKLIAKHLNIDGGVIEYPGIPFASTAEFFEHAIFIPQSIHSKNDISVKDDLRYAFACHGIIAEANKKLVEEVLIRHSLKGFENLKWKELSSGFKLRLELAKVYGIRPKLLILDEPLANLDVNAQKTFLDDLVSLNSSNSYPNTIIFSSQHLQEIEMIADRIIFLHEGKVLYNGRKDLIGSERSENSFELKVSPNSLELSDVISELTSNFQISSWGLNIIIDLPRDISQESLLQHLIKSQVKIEYFRNISNSTRKIFEGLKNPLND